MSKQEDVMAILRLYELRRDPLMREARKWYVTEFKPESAMDIVQLMMAGAEDSARYRMVTSYWDMACSFVNNGAIDEKLFSEANGEYLVVYARIESYIPEVREMFSEPDYLLHLEQFVKRIPNAAQKIETRKRLLERWQTA